MPLYTKYRPKSFTEVIGNKATIESLKSVAYKGTDSHVFLITGDSGTGKTTLGRIIATELGVQDTDYVEVDSADFRGIDTIRNIRSQMNYKPLSGSCRVWLLDECHQLSKDAMSALLKGLEDTPKHVYFILCTTDPEKLLKTIVNRCIHFRVENLTDEELYRLLRKTVHKEGKTLTEDSLRLIAKTANGIPRKAMTLLEKVIDIPEEKIKDAIVEFDSENSEIIELCRALIKRESWNSVKVLLSKLQHKDPEEVRRACLGYSNAVLLKKDEPIAAVIIEEFKEPFFHSGKAGLSLACYKVLLEE